MARLPWGSPPSTQTTSHALFASVTAIGSHHQVTSTLAELHATIDVGVRQRKAALQAAAVSLEFWAAALRREKGIYYTMNKLSEDASKNVGRRSRGWVFLFKETCVRGHRL